MQIWLEKSGEFSKMFTRPTKRAVKIAQLEKAQNPGVKLWKTYLDKTCNDSELLEMIKQSKFRRPPYFEEV